MSDSPIFIVGCPRSGTTLLRDLLNSHPRLAIPRESHFIPSFYQAYGDPKSEREALRLASRLLRLRWVRSWDLNLEASQFADDRSYRRMVSRFFEEHARRENKPRWGDKTPQYAAQIPTLLEIFPRARIIHIYRDGRDVALSLLRAKFGPPNIFSAAAEWKRLVTAGRRDGLALPAESYLEVRYEALLADPERVMQQVCEFVGEPFDPAVLLPTSAPLDYRFASIFVPRKDAKPLRKDIDAANSEKWRRELPEADRVTFESVAGDLLASLGYPTEGKVRRISKLEVWRCKLHHRLWWLYQRLNGKGESSILVHLPTLWMEWAKLRARLRRRGR